MLPCWHFNDRLIAGGRIDVRRHQRHLQAPPPFHPFPSPDPRLAFFFFFAHADFSFLFRPMRILVPAYKLHISKYKFMHAYRLTFALGGISIPCSLFTSHFSLAFKCEPSVTRVLNCLSVLVVITNFKAVIYITRGSTVSFNLNRKKNLNNRKTRVNEWFISLSPNFIIN